MLATGTNAADATPHSAWYASLEDGNRESLAIAFGFVGAFMQIDPE
jgi:hypothetical protein